MPTFDAFIRQLATKYVVKRNLMSGEQRIRWLPVVPFRETPEAWPRLGLSPKWRSGVVTLVLAPNPAAHWSIVMLGAWNARVFTPAWLGNGRFTQAREIELAMPIDEWTAPKIFGFDGIQIEVQFHRVAVRAIRPEDELLTKVRETAAKLVTELTHTPITAVGTNFSYIDSEPTAELTRHFDLRDNGRIAEQEWVINKTTINRVLQKAGGQLNLGLVLQPDGKIRFDLNYHLASTNTAAILAEINQDIIARKNSSRALLESLYYQQ